jgi:hypothetical protein
MRTNLDRCNCQDEEYQAQARIISHIRRFHGPMMLPTGRRTEQTGGILKLAATLCRGSGRRSDDGETRVGAWNTDRHNSGIQLHEYVISRRFDESSRIYLSNRIWEHDASRFLFTASRDMGIRNRK